MSRASRDRIGYMPEERGLYPRMVLEEQLLFMAEIKGTSRALAARRLSPWLTRLGLADWRKKKVNELSKGATSLSPRDSSRRHARATKPR